ncbi:dienelactone hydrolase family protein [Paenibacillus humicola]|uniref:dienelactone hydrolase family protein n=1 Tax=Paenibacillus humicola TaxID=3110540 RepID=UPI00237AE8F6|nr:dienelactone hydrolase family protein [Paenibacillus humicola]
MSLLADWVHYGDDGKYRGYLARPDHVKEPLPAVIVLQEIWGVDEHIRDVTRRIAQAGYVAFAPDLFAGNREVADVLAEDRVKEAKQFLNSIPPAHWRDAEQQKSALAALPEAKGRAIAETLGELFNHGGRMPGYIQQIMAASAWLRDGFEHSRGCGVASVGFCMGGALSGMLAARDPKLSGAVIFYGSAPSADLIPEIGCPVLGLYGELDKRITDEVPAFAEALRAAGKTFEYRIYDGAQHAFFNDTRPSFQMAASRDAFTRTLAFLQRTLTAGEPAVV